MNQNNIPKVVFIGAKETGKSTVGNSSGNAFGCGASATAISGVLLTCAVLGAALIEKRRK